MDKIIIVTIEAGFFTGLFMLSIAAILFIVMISTHSPNPRKLYDDIKRGYENDTKFGGMTGITFKMLYIGTAMTVLFGVLRLYAIL